MGENSVRRHASETHLNIPRELRSSSAPIVRTTTTQRCLQAFQSVDVLGPIWPSISNANQPLVLRDSLAVSDHASLRDAIESGCLLQILDDVRSAPPSTEIDVPTATASTPTRTRDRWIFEATKNALAATNHYVERRLLPDVIAVRPGFSIPDDLEPETVYVVDQLWIVRSPSDGDYLRKIAMIIDNVQNLRQDQSRLDGMLNAMGYEVFHVAGWWALIDPQRVIQEFVTAAAISSLSVLQRTPGTTIESYRCYACDDAMIKSPSGYGIVSHRTVFVHEECFDRAVNEGDFEGLPENDEIHFTVLNSR